MKALNIIFTLVILLSITSCGTRRNSIEGVAKYKRGYHVFDSMDCPTDSFDSIPDECFTPNNWSYEPEQLKPSGPTKKEVREAKRDKRKARRDKKKADKREFILNKIDARQGGRNDRLKTKEDGKTKRVEVRNSRKIENKKTGSSWKNFSLKFFVAIIIATFVFLIVAILRKILKF